MYDELVKRLKTTKVTVYKAEDVNLLQEAADAIVKLQKVGNTLLAKYEEDATTVIWEYSGNIGESLDRLHEEISKYKAQINGKEE